MAEEPGCCCTTTCSQQLCSPPVRIPLGLVWFFYSTHSVWQIAVVMPSSGSKLQSAEWNVVWICPSDTWSLHRKHPLSMVKLLKNHSRIQAATNSYRELTSIYVFCSFCHFLRRWHPETSTPHSHWGFPRGTGHPQHHTETPDLNIWRAFRGMRFGSLITLIVHIFPHGLITWISGGLQSGRVFTKIKEWKHEGEKKPA